MRILFVCLGNICRSPTAEAAFRAAADDAGLDVEIDSAGTAAYHVGEPPDARMTDAGADVGLELVGRARQATPEDLRTYDLVLAMDRSNLEDLRRIAPDEETRERIRLFREFEPDADDLDVPDPYYGGPEGFAEVVRIARDGADGLVRAIEDGRV